ncbi:MAG TPA: hypothetical protein VK669_02170, partial [Candidatus Limnocylindrales bacterium]|nr:hypothetical protein [Candidatus Limnocylindrales bacterium]
GLYFAPVAVNKTLVEGESRSGFPPETPRRPFDVSASCPASLSGAVAQAARTLGAYADAYYAGKKPSEPDGFNVAAHPAKRETWLEFRAENRTLGTAMVSCLSVPAVSTAAIDAAGLGGAFPPSINYAPSVGLYTKTP